jgi:hypothetical protein
MPAAVTAPHGRSGPVQPHTPEASGTHSRALAHNPKHTLDQPQSGMPSVVLV